MAQRRIFQNKDIVNGLGTVLSGQVPAYTDSTYPDQAIPSGDSLAWVQNMNKRFLYHGGTNGSGNWEH